MTYKRSREQQGFEADSSFYIEPSENAKAGRTIDVTSDPPPNLVVEIDASRSSIPKLDLFAQLGVFEVWVWEDNAARFFVLTNDHYVAVDRSQVVPVFTPEILTGFLVAAETDDSADWHRAVKNWVRTLS
jgi:Uma2 family endonuclease